jgi:hypothetical protein
VERFGVRAKIRYFYLIFSASGAGKPELEAALSKENRLGYFSLLEYQSSTRRQTN